MGEAKPAGPTSILRGRGVQNEHTNGPRHAHTHACTHAHTYARIHLYVHIHPEMKIIKIKACKHCHLPIAILGQIWYFKVSIPCLCTLISLCKPCDPRGGAIFDPRGII